METLERIHNPDMAEVTLQDGLVTEIKGNSYIWDTLDKRPELLFKALDLDTVSFPPYIAESWTKENFNWLARTFMKDVVILPDKSSKELLAVGYSAPIHLDENLPENGWEGTVLQIQSDYNAAREPNALVSYSASVAQEARGQGVSGKLLEAFKAHAIESGFSKLVVPSRPSGKTQYPDMTMEEYIKLVDPDTGLHVDPWVRTHQRHGGEIMQVGKNSHVVHYINGDFPSISQWEEWTGMKFPHDGDYTIPGGNAPLHVHDGIGEYREDCIWIQYDLAS